MNSKPVVRKKAVILFLIAILIQANHQSYAWGFWAHKRINRIAVFTLPPEMFAFYKNHIDYLTEHAVDPDKRRFSDQSEAPRHYIDLDHFGTLPFDSFPRKWHDAVAKYSEDTLLAYGIVPWHIQKTYYRLVEAFKEKSTDKVLKYSADIGHYIADAHVPLHTTENYNGQFTGQQGIHAFWESRLPEMFGDTYNYYVGKATYIENPLAYVWEAVISSHIALDSVLTFESKLSKGFPEDQKYSFMERNGTMVRNYSNAYSEAYHSMLEGQVERRIQQSIRAVGSIWMSAWIEAGQPILDNEKSENSEMNNDNTKAIEKELELYEQGRWIGRPE